MRDNTDHTRRRYLKVAGLAGVTGIAGCMGDGGQGTGTGTEATTTGGGGGMGTETTTTGGGGGGQTIQMGTILPITGALSAYGGGMQAAANLAVEHINAAGGPLGREINVNNADSQTQPSKALQKYSTLVNENNIVGFVGAASSGVSVPLAQRVASDQVMQVSNASTTPALDEIGFGEDGNPPKYFGRTAPNDAQQGIVMGAILNRDEYIGADKAAFLYVDNPYGEGLAQQASNAFEGETTNMVAYSKKTTDYSSTLDKLFQGNPQGIGFVGYPGNGQTILKQWSQGGYGGEWILSEGLNSKSFLQENSSITSGMYITSPNPESTSGATAFEEAMGEQAGTLFAPHAYDAMFLQALAIQAAGEASGTAIAENIQSVSRPSGDGDTTITVNEFQKAKDALNNGESINYEGASSPCDMLDTLTVLNRFAILQVQDDGSRETLKTFPRSFFRDEMGN